MLNLHSLLLAVYLIAPSAAALQSTFVTAAPLTQTQTPTPAHSHSHSQSVRLVHSKHATTKPAHAVTPEHHARHPSQRNSRPQKEVPHFQIETELIEELKRLEKQLEKLQEEEEKQEQQEPELDIEGEQEQSEEEAEAEEDEEEEEPAPAPHHHQSASVDSATAFTSLTIPLLDPDAPSTATTTSIADPFTSAASSPDVLIQVRDLFTVWKRENGKNYTTIEEDEYRLLVFERNLLATNQSIAELYAQNIAAHVATRSSATSGAETSGIHSVTRLAYHTASTTARSLGMSVFSDQTSGEFKRRLGYKPGAASVQRKEMIFAQTSTNSNSNSTGGTDATRAAGDVRQAWVMPAAFNWVTLGATTPVRDQQECGSCWAFSAVNGVESALFMKTRLPPPLLSPQHLISCDRWDSGCKGGDLPTAYQFIYDSGVNTDKNYPYTSGPGFDSGRCLVKGTAADLVRIRGYSYATKPCTRGACKAQNELQMAQRLMQFGPLSVCLTAAVWQNYVGEGAVMTQRECGSAAETMDHCVQLVGWNTDRQGIKYWIVRNQWGASWGNAGFIYLKYGENTCGIANEATFVVV